MVDLHAPFPRQPVLRLYADRGGHGAASERRIVEGWRRQRFLAALHRYARALWPSVVSLQSCSRPAAITGFVVSIRVDAI